MVIILYAQLPLYWVRFVLQVSEKRFPYLHCKEVLLCLFCSFAGAMLVSCLYYVVFSLYKFIRSGGIDDDDDFNNVTDIELLEQTNKDILDHGLDHDYDHDHDQPSTSYN